MAAEKQRNTKGDKKDKSGDIEEAEFLPSITMKIQEG